MDLKKNLENCRGKTLLVIGDVICDRYLFSRPGRLSREAPVMILEYEGEEIIPGGAANVALNLSELGANVFLAGWIGDDTQGKTVKKVLADRSISPEGIWEIQGHPTVLKTRILAGGQNQTVKQQVLRLDQGQNPPKTGRGFEKIKETIGSLLNKVDGVVFSDYGYGTVYPALVGEVIKLRNQKEFLLAGDSRQNLGYYQNFDLLTPNEVEAGDFAKTGSLEKMGQKIKKKLKPEALVITRGGRGMSLFEGSDRAIHIPPAGFTPVADVSGAGDTVISALMMGRLGGATWLEGAYLASFAAAVVVRKSGTAVASPQEILSFARGKEAGEDDN